MDANAHLRLLITRRLEELGWTRSELARHMGTHPVVVYDHLKGRKGFTGATLTKYLDALGVDLSFSEAQPMTKEARNDEVGDTSVEPSWSSERVS